MPDSRSLRVVLATIGSRGDVQPMLALALALRARGHRPLLVAPPDFASAVGARGIEFAPAGTDIQAFLAGQADVLTGSMRRAAGAIGGFFREQLPLQARCLMQACAGADIVVWGGLGFAALSVAEHLGLPALGLVFTTCIIPSDRHPPPTSTRHGLPGWINRLLWRQHQWIAQRLIGRPLNDVRATLGLLPKRLGPQLLDDWPIVIAADPEILPPDPAWAGRYPHAGFLFLDDPAELDPELDRWLAAGPPPLFIGFGSMSGPGTRRVGALLGRALAPIGMRVLVGTGWSGLDPARLPPGWRTVAEAPHAKLFPRVAAVVHHGGSGTTAAALRAGVPQVIVPLLLDQYHHAHRLFRMGLAPRPVAMETIDAPQLQAAVRWALARPAGPRRAAADRLRASGACAVIVDRIESLARQERPVKPRG